MAPLGMEARVGLGTVFDMVADATPVKAGEGGAWLADLGSADADAAGAAGAAGAPPRTMASLGPPPPSRRWAATPAPAPLAPPPSFQTPAARSASARLAGVSAASADEVVLEVGSPEFSNFQEAPPPPPPAADANI
jgi:hypothetical protein